MIGRKRLKRTLVLFAAAILVALPTVDSARCNATFDTAGSFNWIPPPGVTSVALLLVAGGGGGGASTDRTAGGGGGGGVLCKTSETVMPGVAKSVVVGFGGQGGAGTCTARNAHCPEVGGNGGNSLFGSLQAYGGGGGAAGLDSDGDPLPATFGGSGGGAYHNGDSVAGLGTSGQGYAGGSKGYDSGSNNVSRGQVVSFAEQNSGARVSDTANSFVQCSFAVLAICNSGHSLARSRSDAERLFWLRRRRSWRGRLSRHIERWRRGRAR